MLSITNICNAKNTQSLRYRRAHRHLRRETALRPLNAKFRNIHEGDPWQDGEPPWPRNNEFVDRDRELEQLWQTLKPQRGPRRECLVSGVAGIGKTQLALEFAYRYGKEYSRCTWIDGEDSPPLRSVNRGIHLIIIDMATSFAMNSIDKIDWCNTLESLPSHDASVLITARPPADHAQVMLDGIPEEDAVKWLNEALPESAQGWNQAPLQTLCQAVHCLPFPLNVIRRVLRRSYRSPAEVLDRVQELGPRSWLAQEIERDPSLSYCPVEALPMALEVLQ